MQYKYQLIFFVVILFSAGCIHKEKKYPDGAVLIKPDADVSAKKRKDILRVSTFADSISYIPLNTDSSVSIGKINKILYLRNRFVLFDRALAKGIFLFDHTGRLINKIYRGKEPFEIKSIEDVTVDYPNNKIYIYSGAQSCIFVLNENGEKEKVITVGNGYFSTFEKLHNGFVFYRELESIVKDDPFNNFRLCIVDSLGQFKKGWFNTIRNPKFQVPISSVFFRRINGTGAVYFESPDFDTLLTINENNAHLDDFCYFDFNKSNNARKRIFRAQNLDEYLSAIQHSTSLNESPLISDRLILGDYSIKGGLIYNYYYDRATKMTTSMSGMINDLDEIPLGLGGYYSLSTNRLITKVDNERLLDEIDLQKDNNRSLSDGSREMQYISGIVTEDPEKIIICLLKLRQ